MRWETENTEPSTWYGVLFESTGRGLKRMWPVEFRGIDEDGDRAIVATTIPPTKKWEDLTVTILSITPVEKIPTDAKLYKPMAKRASDARVKVLEVDSRGLQEGRAEQVDTESVVQMTKNKQGTTPSRAGDKGAAQNEKGIQKVTKEPEETQALSVPKLGQASQQMTQPIADDRRGVQQGKTVQRSTQTTTEEQKKASQSRTQSVAGTKRGTQKDSASEQELWKVSQSRQEGTPTATDSGQKVYRASQSTTKIVADDKRGTQNAKGTGESTQDTISEQKGRIASQRATSPVADGKRGTQHEMGSRESIQETQLWSTTTVADDKRGPQHEMGSRGSIQETQLWSTTTVADDKRGPQHQMGSRESTQETELWRMSNTTVADDKRGTQQDTGSQQGPEQTAKEVYLGRASQIDDEGSQDMVKGGPQTTQQRQPGRQGKPKDKQGTENLPRTIRAPRTIDEGASKVRPPVTIDVDAENDENVGTDTKGDRPVEMDVDANEVLPRGQYGTRTDSMGTKKENAIDVDAEVMAKSEWQIADEYYHMAVADSRPGECVHGCLMDLLITRAYDAAPATVQAEWEVFSVATTEAPPKVKKTKWMKPVNYEQHYVLVVSEGDRLTVYDSEPTHSSQVRDFLVKRIGRERQFTVVNTGPQQLNNCAFHTAAAAAKLLGVPVPSP